MKAKMVTREEIFELYQDGFPGEEKEEEKEREKEDWRREGKKRDRIWEGKVKGMEGLDREQSSW